MSFNLKFETKESTLAIIGAIATLFGFQIFYFTLVIPFDRITHGSASFSLFFWSSFFMWGVLGFVMYLRKTKKDIRRAQDASLVFAVLLSATMALATTDSYLLPIPYSFPGFPAGIAVNGSILLIKRVFHRRRMS